MKKWPMAVQLVIDSEKGFQIGFGWIALLANEVTTERASTNHSTARKNQFENLSELSVLTYPMNILCVVISFTKVPKSRNCLKYISYCLRKFISFSQFFGFVLKFWLFGEF